MRAVRAVRAWGTLVFALLWTSAGLAAPYEDTQGRFRLELSEGWVLTPRFGDTQGMVFSRQGGRRGPKIALFMVRVEEAQGALSEWIRALEAGLRAEPGFERLAERQTKIAGRAAIIRDYKTQVGPSVEKRIRWYIFAKRSSFYLLHAETERRFMRTVMPEIKRMVRSFQAGPEEPEAAEVSSKQPPLLGAWVADSGLVLELREGQRFSLADVSGRYEVDQTTLSLMIPGRQAQRFQYQLDLVQGTLVLSAPGLPAPIRYRRRTRERPGPSASPSANPSASSSAEGAAALVGRWGAGSISLVLFGDRRFKMGSNFEGRWKAEGARLELIRGGSESLTYRYELKGERLTLSGADLDRPLVFTRVGDPR